MVGHRLETISVIQTFLPLLFPRSKVKVLVAMVLHSHFSQFLLFSESPMMLPNFLNHCMSLQALVGQVDSQKRFREHSCPLVYFAAFSIRGWAFFRTRGNKSLMRNVGTAGTAR